MYADETKITEIIANIEKVVIGKRDAIEMSIVAMLVGGHVLLEDVPGVGKTMMVRAIAKTLNAEYKRIQFTPDLLPSDVTGASIYNQREMTFEFRAGPIMANIVLADEINRTSPKTQAALLEALEEGSVTVDGETKPLTKPFFVMATQNPLDFGGTFPLPEAQLDRFLFKLNMGYPTFAEEVEVLNRLESGHPLEEVTGVLTLLEWEEMQARVRKVYVDEAVKSYIVRFVSETRKHERIHLGVSPRGSIALMKAAQAYAFIKGRDFVIPDDVKYLASPTLAHRIVVEPSLEMQQTQPKDLIAEIGQNLHVPASSKEAIK